MSENVDIVIELRSDTFTKPNQRMREAMMNADVGDSSYNEDPTIIRLQDEIAGLLGKESSLFFPSGTMSNLTAIMAHCDQRGCEIIVGHKSHFNMWEQGGVSQVAGVYVKQIENLDDGTFDLDKLVEMISEDDPGCPVTKVVCLENTQNYCGGRILPLEFIEKVASICKKYNMKLHLDGSRVMNAAIASNVDVKKICKHFDTVNFCCSKGLGAPVGSLLAGSEKLIKQVFRARQVLGGSMRQSGVLAAPALVGLEEMYEKIEADHKHAKSLAKGLIECSNGFLDINLDNLETNIIMARIMDDRITSKEFIQRLYEVTDEEFDSLHERIIVKFSYIDKRVLRIVTHCDFSAKQMDHVFKKIEYVTNDIERLVREIKKSEWK